MFVCGMSDINQTVGCQTSEYQILELQRKQIVLINTIELCKWHNIYFMYFIIAFLAKKDCTSKNKVIHNLRKKISVNQP